MNVSLERFKLRGSKHRVRRFTVNHHGSILFEVAGQWQIVILVALIALQRPAVDALKLPIRDILCQYRIVASSEQDVNVGTVRRSEIAWAKKLSSARLLIDRRTAAGLLRFSFESGRKDRLRLTTRIKGCGLADLLIDPEFLGPECPPKCDENRKGNRHQYPFPSQEPCSRIDGHSFRRAMDLAPLALTKSRDGPFQF